MAAGSAYAPFTNLIAGVMGYSASSCADGAREVREQVRILLAEYSRLADRLSLSRPDGPESRVSAAALRQAALGCLGSSQTNPDTGRGAIAVVMASEWVQDLERLEGDLEDAVNAAVDAARKPWWR